MKKDKTFVWILTANGCGTLGGPMGTEHEGPVIFRKTFKTEAAAKEYAQKHVGDVDPDGAEPVDWQRLGRGLQGADARWVLFDLERSEVSK